MVWSFILPADEPVTTYGSWPRSERYSARTSRKLAFKKQPKRRATPPHPATRLSNDQRNPSTPSKATRPGIKSVRLSRNYRALHHQPCKPAVALLTGKVPLASAAGESSPNTQTVPPEPPPVIFAP